MSADFEDVDFTKFPQYVMGDTGRLLGATSREYSEVAPVVDQAEWKAMIEAMEEDGGGAERLVVEVKDQKQEGSCVGNAGTGAMQVLMARQVGKDRVTKLSACSLYQLIGRSPNSGASIDDCLEELRKTGCIPLDTPENRAEFGDVVMPATGFYTKRPAGWQEVAARFRLLEWWEVKGEGQLITALLNQHPVVVGRDGHSICYLRPMYRNGQLGVLYVNSWGSWGFGAGSFSYGFGWDSMSKVRSSARWAFALTSVT